jgi:hypothetical protein
VISKQSSDWKIDIINIVYCSKNQIRKREDHFNWFFLKKKKEIGEDWYYNDKHYNLNGVWEREKQLYPWLKANQNKKRNTLKQKKK